MVATHFPSGEPDEQKAAICTQRGSISSPYRLSRSTASAASTVPRPSSSIRMQAEHVECDYY